ncbi:prolyl oligopeptidase family serine peptidase [Horticoccus sp. 23ND18S-11]|uniref:prolyl oligopeptidase family serine peptidase n=1 Tax=Horticoccus sp. 23ND18S-11 TaxID=3391832 RepID=UPI0039C93236
MPTRPLLRHLALAALALAFSLSAAPAQTPPPPAKRLPPAGIRIPDAARTELAAGAAALRTAIDAVARELNAAGNTRLVTLLPDVEVLHKAVDWALRYDEFFDVKQVEVARRFLALGRERVQQLQAGTAPWIDATGLILRGHRSKLDDSVQPYALVVPPDWKRGSGPARRLDVVLAGRNEKRTELAFLAEHETKPGEIVPEGAIVLHPYGRFCNATKFAGEVDVFEAMEAVKGNYAIDPARIIVRGFSMGGASTWHLAAHFPGVWAAAAPGAGFAETAAYTKALAPGKPERTPWEQTLWRWYDATGYAANLRGVPTVAYSGEIDPQKQAADIMTEAMAAEGLKLEHLIGPKTAHKYHPETKAVLAARLDALAAAGRPAWPAEDHLTTYTLRYSRSARIAIMELEQPWERADVRVRFPSPDRLEATTRNVGVFSVRWEKTSGLKATIDGQPVEVGAVAPAYWFVKDGGKWVFRDAAFADERWAGQQRKIPGLSGPINDAFMAPFLFVRPTGRPLNPAVGAWVAAELQHATKLWRDLFRGDVLIKDDTDVTDDDIARKHLVLWGDPASNRVIAKVLAAGKLPLTWNARNLTFRGKAYAAEQHAPILVFPNPLAAGPRYVVFNSGIDFRDEAYGTNALQTPKLPDFALVDLREIPGPRWPGRIVDAGFFNAAWK